VTFELEHEKLKGDALRTGGRQCIVIARGGGKNGAASGSSIVAFALPNRTSDDAGEEETDSAGGAYR
jgi:hypothetical protein